MIDKQKFINWIQLPPQHVTFERNGSTDPLKRTAYVSLQIANTPHRYHVIQTGDTFTLEETSYCVGNPSAPISNEHGDDERDAAEFVEASYTPNLADELDSLSDFIAEQFTDLHLPRRITDRIATWHQQQLAKADERTQSLALRSVVAYLLQPGNLSIRAWGLAYAAGLDCAQGRSMTETGQQLGCTRAAISKETNRWLDLLNLDRSRYCKSEAARESYRKVQTENHWRHRTS